MKKIIKILLTLIAANFITLNAQAKFVSNGFLVTKKQLDFSKTIRSGSCSGKVPYPVLSNGDEELILRINDEIHDFIELYSVCNQDERDHFSVDFDIPESGTRDYFSIRWITKKDDKIWRIDILNFDRDTGRFIDANDIFHIMSKNLMEEIAKLSDGHLTLPFRWEDFIEKIDNRDIQFYVEKEQWFLIFNSTQLNEKVTITKIPEYFLKKRLR